MYNWHTSRIWLPDHANHILLVTALATAWTLSLGAFAFDDCDLKRHAPKGFVQTYSLFRLGLRFLDGLVDHSAPVLLPLRPLRVGQ